MAGHVERITLQTHLCSNVGLLSGLHALVDQRETDLNSFRPGAVALQIAQCSKAYQIEAGLRHIVDVLLQSANAVILRADGEFLGMIGRVIGQAQTHLCLSILVQHAIFQFVHGSTLLLNRLDNWLCYRL